MAGQTDQRLARLLGEVKCLERGGFGSSAVSSCLMPTCPGEATSSLSELRPAPSQPGVVCFQPRPSSWQVTRVEPEIGRESLQEEALFLVDEVTRFGVRTPGKERSDLPPGGLRITAVAGDRGVRSRDFTSQAVVARCWQVPQEIFARLAPATVEDEAAQPGESGERPGASAPPARSRAATASVAKRLRTPGSFGKNG